MQDPPKLSITLAAALSKHKALFWKSQLVDKDMTVEALIRTRLPDMSYYDAEHVYAIRNETGEILDKNARLQWCGLHPGEKIKIVTLSPKEVEAHRCISIESSSDTRSKTKMKRVHSSRSN